MMLGPPGNVRRVEWFRTKLLACSSLASLYWSFRSPQLVESSRKAGYPKVIDFSGIYY